MPRSKPASPYSISLRAMATARRRRSSAPPSLAAAGRGPRHQQMQSRQPAAQPGGGHPAPLDRASLQRLRLSRIDLFFLHSNIVPDDRPWLAGPTRRRAHDSLCAIRRSRAPGIRTPGGEGLIGAWGLTGIGHPDTIIKLLAEHPAPAAVQCIANLLDSPGGLKFFDGPAKPRDVMAAARANGVGVMGIRAVQAGALTAAIDRAAAARPSGDAGLCPCCRVPRAMRRTWRESGCRGASLRTVAADRHVGAGGEEPAGTGGVRRRGGSGAVAARVDRPHRRRDALIGTTRTDTILMMAWHLVIARHLMMARHRFVQRRIPHPGVLAGEGSPPATSAMAAAKNCGRPAGACPRATLRPDPWAGYHTWVNFSAG